MFRMISSLVVGLGFVLLLPGAAEACRCRPPSFQVAYKRAQAVVVARVVSIENRANNVQVAVLSVSQAWKRDLPARLTVIAGGQVCGFSLEENREYVLYLFVNSNQDYATSNCVGNKFIDHPKLPPPDAAAAKEAVAWLQKHGKSGKVE